MAIHLEIHEEDEKELARLRSRLIGARGRAGLTQQQVALRVRHSDKWINELEQGIGHPHLSSLQDWASVFDLRLEPSFWDLVEWGPEDVPTEIVTNWQFSYKMSRPFAAREWCRVHIVNELAAYRHAAQISGAELSRRMGLSVSAVSGWERDGNNPLVSKVFTYVRALGGSVMFELIERADWPHE